MKYAAAFLALGLVCVVWATRMPQTWQRVLLGSCAIAAFGVALAYGGFGPRVFRKQSNGRLPLVSFVLFWPYHLLNILALRADGRLGRGNAFDQVGSGLYLGRRLQRSEAGRLERLGVRAVLDLTCEFGEPLAIRRLGEYRCIPLLDATAPTLDELFQGTAWIGERIGAGPVYVHCALGHGRSATFAAAWLLLSGEASSAEEAVAKVRAARPEIGLHPAQMARLRELEPLTAAWRRGAR